MADLKPIYKAVSANEAERQLTEFTKKWTKYPAVSRVWRDQWDHVIPFFSFPEEVRKAVYTTNAVESLHSSLRKIIKTRGCVRYSGLAHFDTLIWPTPTVDILPHLRPERLQTT